jgi:protein-S-isoprenylcysteine O-methyltransferase Ste14
MLAALENRVPPPMVMAGTALLMWGLSALAPGGLQSTPLRIAGLAIFLLAGLALAGAGLAAFRRAGTTIDPTRPESASTIVTGGVLRAVDSEN